MQRVRGLTLSALPVSTFTFLVSTLASARDRSTRFLHPDRLSRDVSTFYNSIRMIPKKLLDKQIPSRYSCLVYSASHPRRPPDSWLGLAPISHPLSPNSPLSPLESAVLDKHRVLPVFSRNRLLTSPLECAVPRDPTCKSFRMRTSKKLGGYSPSHPPSIFRIHFQVPYPASPLLATLAKTPGGVGVFFPFWNSSLVTRIGRGRLAD